MLNQTAAAVDTAQSGIPQRKIGYTSRVELALHGTPLSYHSAL